MALKFSSAPLANPLDGTEIMLISQSVGGVETSVRTTTAKILGLSPLAAAFGTDPATTTGLTYGYVGGNVYSNGADVSIASGTVALTASTTNYVQRTAAGVVSVSTTGFTVGLIPMAQVVTGGGTITSITDKRPASVDLRGRQTVALSGSNVTLSDAQANARILSFTGTLTANVVVTFPAYQQEWIVSNETTGAFTLQVQTAGGSPLTVLQGCARVVYGNGTLVKPADNPDPSLITGAKMTWGSATSLSVTSGRMYVPSLGGYLDLPSTLTLSALSLTASTFYHVYAYSNAGTAAVECVTTAPSAPYYGTARTKTGDTSRRYVGSVLTDASGNVYNFRHDAEGAVLYRVSIDTAFKVLVGNATVATTVSCAAVVPVTATKAFANIINNDTTHAAWIGNADVVPSSTGSYLELVGYGSYGTTLSTVLTLDSTQSFQYLMQSGATANLVVRLKGYTFER